MTHESIVQLFVLELTAGILSGGIVLFAIEPIQAYYLNRARRPHRLDLVRSLANDLQEVAKIWKPALDNMTSRLKSAMIDALSKVVQGASQASPTREPGSTPPSIVVPPESVDQQGRLLIGQLTAAVARLDHLLADLDGAWDIFPSDSEHTATLVDLRGLLARSRWGIHNLRLLLLAETDEAAVELLTLATDAALPPRAFSGLSGLVEVLWRSGHPKKGIALPPLDLVGALPRPGEQTTLVQAYVTARFPGMRPQPGGGD